MWPLAATAFPLRVGTPVWRPCESRQSLSAGLYGLGQLLSQHAQQSAGGHAESWQRLFPRLACVSRLLHGRYRQQASRGDHEGGQKLPHRFYALGRLLPRFSKPGTGGGVKSRSSLPAGLDQVRCLLPPDGDVIGACCSLLVERGCRPFPREPSHASV